jgi:hypothetical protein
VPAPRRNRGGMWAKVIWGNSGGPSRSGLKVVVKLRRKYSYKEDPKGSTMPWWKSERVTVAMTRRTTQPPGSEGPALWTCLAWQEGRP